MKQDKVAIYNAIAIAIALIFTVLYMLTPVMLDDLAFGRFTASFRANPSWAQFWQDWTAGIRHVYITDNGRLVNLVSIALLLLPKCLNDILCGIAIYVLIAQGARLARVWGRNLPGYALWVVVVVFVLPWYDFMFTFVFAANYLIASAMLVWGLNLLLCGRPRSLVLTALLALLIGWMHEAVAAAGIGATLGLIICFPKYRRMRRTYVWLGGFVCALAIIALSPAAVQKGNNILHFADVFNLLKRPDMSALFYLFGILLVCGLAKGKWRKYFFTPRLALLFGGAFGAWGVCRLALYDGYRPAWQMMVLSGIALGYILAVFVHRQNRLSTVCSLVVLGACIIQPLACVPWFEVLRTEVELANRAVAEVADGSTVFVPMHNDAKQAWYTLNKPQFGLYCQRGFPEGRAVPAELADFDPAKARVLGGDAPAYYYKDNFVLPYNPDQLGWGMVCIDYGPTEFTPEAVMTPFECPAGKFIYVHTIHAFSKLQLFQPQSIKVLGIEFPPATSTNISKNQ